VMSEACLVDFDWVSVEEPMPAAAADALAHWPPGRNPVHLDAMRADNMNNLCQSECPRGRSVS
jgi:hypothetical protein